MNPQSHWARLVMKRMKTIPRILILIAAAGVAISPLTSVNVSAAFVHFQGNVIAVATDKIALETADGSILTLRTSPTSRFLEKGKPIKLGQLREGDHVDVDVVQDTKGGFVIVEVRLQARTQVDENAGPPKLVHRPAGSAPAPSSAAAARSVARPTEPVAATPEPERPNRQVAEGTIPRDLPMPDRSDVPGDRPYATRSADPKMELVERAREAAFEFSEKLPNYVCQQQTTRYVSETRPVNWHAQDTVSASVVYENGREDYRNISVNGRPVNKKMAEIGGTWSEGEFGTTLLSLFHPGAATTFKFVKETVMSRMTTALYDFSVTQPHSIWEINAEGQSFKPASRGSVWIDTNTARVIRIEMETVDLPSDFPEDMVQMAVDYDFVNLGTERYLLPTRSENISCLRRSVMCGRNVIDFRNYHKYLGESKIIYDAPK
jgi:hypothetical protein